MGSVGLTTSYDHTHSVQFYTTDEFLVGDLCRFVGTALVQGQAAVVVSTPAHQQSLITKLQAFRKLDVTSTISEGRLQFFDAAALLSHFVNDGQFDRPRFLELAGAIIARASSACRDKDHRVVVFGEMVALLWSAGKAELALELEKAWNALSQTHCFSLRCGYPMMEFSSAEHSAQFMNICDEHSLVIPAGTHAEFPTDDPGIRDVILLQQRASASQSEVEWRHREQKYKSFVDAVQDYAIFMLDPEGRVTSWNRGAEGIKGYRESEILGRHYSCFYPPEALEEGKPQRLLGIAERAGRVEDEGWRVRKNGDRFWAHVTITAIRDQSGHLVGFGKVTRDLTERKRTEEFIRQQEARFQMFVHAVQDYAILMLDPQGNIATWNLGAERLKGYEANEIIGKHFSIFYPASEQDEKPKYELEVAAREGRFEDEGWRLRKDGSRFWANVVITAIRDDAGRLVGFGKVTRDLTDRMLALKALEESESKLRRSEKSLRELSLHLLRSQDEERRRIGREMHDSLGQYLSVLKLKLESMAAPEANSSEMNSCIDLLDCCLKEVRTVSYLLYPPMLEELGLKSAVQWYLAGFSKRSGIQTDFQVPEDFGRIGRDAELVLFRVLQEALTNVQRHSGSTTAAIRICTTYNSVVLEVQDYGNGLPSVLFERGGQDWMGSAGVGLRGMSERLQQLGGALDVSSSPAGTLVRATVPVERTVTTRQQVTDIENRDFYPHGCD
jgi:PAS domain S-box-containing protein